MDGRDGKKSEREAGIYARVSIFARKRMQIRRNAMARCKKDNIIAKVKRQRKYDEEDGLGLSRKKNITQTCVRKLVKHISHIGTTIIYNIHRKHINILLKWFVR